MPPFRSQHDAFEFKSTRVDLVVFLLKTTDLTTVATALEAKLQEHAEFFSNEPLLIDVSQVKDQQLLDQQLDLPGLLAIMQQFNLLPVALRPDDSAYRPIAKAHKLALWPEEKASLSAKPKHEPALVINRPVRTGQQIYAANRDLVVLDLVSAGAELIADGSIHVYAPLRGRAIAGATGNHDTRIYTTCMQAELLSIAGIYRALDEALPDSLKEKAAQVYLEKDKLVIEALHR